MCIHFFKKICLRNKVPMFDESITSWTCCSVLHAGSLFYHQQFTESQRNENLNSLRCAVICSKTSACGLKYPCLTNQERDNCAACQTFVLIKKMHVSLPFHIFNIVLCYSVLTQRAEIMMFTNHNACFSQFTIITTVFATIVNVNVVQHMIMFLLQALS